MKNEKLEPLRFPVNPGAFVDRGNEAVENDDFDAAIAEFTKAISVDPEYAPHYGSRGAAYIRKGDMDAAIADFNKGLSLDPGNTIWYYGRGSAYAYKGTYDAAVTDLTRAILKDPTNADAVYNRAMSYANLGKTQKALADFTQAIALESHNAEYYRLRGKVYVIAGDDDAAIADFDQAISLNKNLDETYYDRGLARGRKGNLTGALADIVWYISLKPDDAEAYLNRGLVYYKLGDLDACIEDWEKTLEIDPSFKEAKDNLEVVYKVREERAKAGGAQKKIYKSMAIVDGKEVSVDEFIARMERAYKINPKDKQLRDELYGNYHNYGIEFISQEQWDKAIEQFNKAIALDTNSADSNIGRGLCLVNKGDFDAAVADGEQALKLNGADTQVRHNVGAIYEYRGIDYVDRKDLDKALEDFNRALELNPDSANAYNYRSYIYYEKENNDKALEDCNALIKLAPNSSEAYFRRGCVYEAKIYKKGGGRECEELAKADWRHAAELNPDGDVAPYERLGYWYFENIEFEKCVEAYTNAIRINPNNAEYYDGRANAYNADDKYEEAIKDWLKVLEFTPDDADVKESLSYAYTHCGDEKWFVDNIAAAIADLQAAIRLLPSNDEALDSLGIIYRDQGNYDAAIETWEAYLAIKPDDASAKKLLEDLRKKRDGAGA
jgi:tetratricopeptide (TPR) repeat protein